MSVKNWPHSRPDASRRRLRASETTRQTDNKDYNELESQEDSIRTPTQEEQAESGTVSSSRFQEDFRDGLSSGAGKDRGQIAKGETDCQEENES